MYEQPCKPRDDSAEAKGTHFRDRCIPANRRHDSLVGIVEVLRRLTAQKRLDIPRHKPALLHRDWRQARQRLSDSSPKMRLIADDENLAVAGNGAVLIDDHTSLRIERHAEARAEWRCRIARRPHDCLRGDLLAALQSHALCRDLLDTRPEAHIHAQIHELLERALWKLAGKCGQDLRAALNQKDTGLRRVNVPEVLDQGDARDLRDCSRHLHAGRPAAHDHKRHRSLAFRVIMRLLRDLESHQHPLPDIQRIIETLEAGCVLLPFGTSEIRVPRACSDHEKVVVQRPVRCDDSLVRDVDALRFAEDHLRIFLIAQNVTQRLRDVRGRERRRRHLIQQRLEEMMILAIQKREPHIRFLQSFRGLQPAKAAADDDYAPQVAMMDIQNDPPAKIARI